MINIIGKDLGIAYEIPPNMKNQAFYPALCMKNAEIKFNFGDSNFKYFPSVISNLTNYLI